jgi:hypothetical protein
MPLPYAFPLLTAVLVHGAQRRQLHQAMLEAIRVRRPYSQVRR